MTQLVLKVPDKDTPGYPKRLYRASKLQADVKNQGFTPELVENIIAFLSDYTSCDDSLNKTDLLWDLSENQFNDMLNAVKGGSNSERPLVEKAPEVQSQLTTLLQNKEPIVMP